jgi:MFS family permease
MGQLIMGWACSGLFVLGPSYIDDISPATRASVHLGIWYAIGAVGPAVGFCMYTFFLILPLSSFTLMF